MEERRIQWCFFFCIFCEKSWTVFRFQKIPYYDKPSPRRWNRTLQYLCFLSHFWQCCKIRWSSVTYFLRRAPHAFRILPPKKTSGHFRHFQSATGRKKNCGLWRRRRKKSGTLAGGCRFAFRIIALALSRPLRSGNFSGNPFPKSARRRTLRNVKKYVTDGHYFISEKRWHNGPRRPAFYAKESVFKPAYCETEITKSL